VNLPAEPGLALRRRSPWEAADSGVLLWQKNFVWFIPFFALPVWIAAFALRFLPDSFRPWSCLFIWWLKPFFDRPALHVLGIRFFEPQSSLKRLFRGLPASLGRGLAGDLLWRRFSPWRASRMPLRLLEKKGGAEFRRRKKILERGGLDFCLLITALFLAVELVLLLGEIAFVLGIISLFRPDLEFGFGDIFVKGEIFIFAAYCFNYMLIESLYLCMGFGIYINSRVEVEGWDLQLLFCQFAAGKTLPPARDRGLRKPAALLCLFLLGPLTARAEPLPPGEPPETALEAAQEAASAAETETWGAEFWAEAPEPPLAALGEILGSRDFGGEEKGWGIRFKGDDEENSPDETGDGEQEPWMARVRRIAAQALRALLVTGALAGAAFSLYRLFKAGGSASPADRGLSRGLGSLRPDEPGALLEKAGELRRGGRLREAWAACLAGTIAAYSRRYGLRFPAEATEYGCLALVRAAGGQRAGFEALIRRWVRYAYGGIEPGAGEFEDSLGYGFSLLTPPAGGGAARG
jgi:hypothetical protein